MPDIAGLRNRFEAATGGGGGGDKNGPPPPPKFSGGGGAKKKNEEGKSEEKKPEGGSGFLGGGAGGGGGASAASNAFAMGMMFGSVWEGMNKATAATTGAVGGAMENMMKKGEDFKNPFEKTGPKRWGDEGKKKEEGGKKNEGWFGAIFAGKSEEVKHNRAYDPLHTPNSNYNNNNNGGQRGPRGIIRDMPPEPPPFSEFETLNAANRGVYKTTRACGMRVERSCGPSGPSGKILQELQYSDDPIRQAGKIGVREANESVENTTRSCGHGAERVCGRGTFFGRNLEEMQHKYIDKDIDKFEKIPKRPGEGRRVANRYYEDDTNNSFSNDHYPQQQHHLQNGNGGSTKAIQGGGGGGYQPGPQSDGWVAGLLKPYNDPFEDEYDHLGRVERKDYVPGRLSV